MGRKKGLPGIPAETIQEIRSLRAEGVTLHEIERRTGVSYVTVQRYTRDMEGIRQKGRRLTEEQIQEMQRMRREGMTGREISEKTGVSYSAVRRHLAGISPEWEEKVRRLYLDGKPYARIIAETGVSAQTIRNYTRDLPRRNGNRDGAPLPPKKAERARELRTQGKSYKAIAGLLGMHPTTVKKYAGDIPVEKEAEQPSQTGGLCRHKKTCIYWRPITGGPHGICACHYPIDRDELRPWPADQCPGFPKKKGKHEN